MTTRVVLGYGSLAQAVVSALADRSGELLVLAGDETAVETLREEGIAAEVVDITDPAVLREQASPETVVVATDDGQRNEAAAGATRRAFPGAFLLVYAGTAPPKSRTARLSALADEVVDPGRVAVDHLGAVTGEGGVRARKLLSVLRDLDGPLAVVTHDNPDPDAIASAVALQRLTERAGGEGDICYYGNISHQENRAFVNLLEFDLRNLEDGADIGEYAGVALVDHSRAGVNDGLPEETDVDIVIDHHPPRLPVEARFVDLRSDVGATSTLLVDYYRRLDVTPDEATATGLLFGIRVDTDEFTREVSPDDFEAAAFLLPHADFGTLERIDSPSVSADTLETIGRAIRNRKRHGPALVSGVGYLTDRDALAQAADRLLDLEDVTTTFVYGVDDGTVYVSARARGTDGDLGETLREAFGQIGSAGGHAGMAGAQLSLGLLESVDTDHESLVEVVDAVVTDRFLDAFDSRTHRVIRDVYPDDFHGGDELGSDEYVPDDARPPGSDTDPAGTTGDDTDGSDRDDHAGDPNDTTGDGSDPPGQDDDTEDPTGDVEDPTSDDGDEAGGWTASDEGPDGRTVGDDGSDSGAASDEGSDDGSPPEDR
jgi:nanoRNase/pAp phosphatase (c-di-AMP/oligoRNAs hydrolase)